MRDWEEEVRGAALRAKQELREAIAYGNHRIVPAARAEVARAGQQGARLLRRLADRLDARVGRG